MKEYMGRGEREGEKEDIHGQSGSDEPEIWARPRSPRTLPAANDYFHGFSRPRDQMPPDQISVSTRQKASKRKAAE